MSEDTISRQAAINALTSHIMPHNNEDGTVTIGVLSKSSIKNILNKLPSAQTEKRTEERTETHTCDYINRKDAIDAHYEYCNKHPDAGFPVWSLKILEDLPSAQPDLEEAYICGETEAEARFHNEIVRCKNCKYNSNTCGNYVNCDIIPQMFGRTTDNFCSRAERRTDGN